MKKVFKIFLITFVSIIAIVLGLMIALQTKWGKNILREQIESFLQEKLQTTVAIKNIDYNIPNSLSLNGVLVLDRRQDTLVWLNDLNVQIDMLAIINSKISINKLAIDGLYGNIYRQLPDTTFNFQFIIDAFVPNNKDAALTEVADSTTAKTGLSYDAGTIDLKNIRFNFNDTTGGSFFNINLGSLVLKPKKINLDSLQFEVTDLTIKNVVSSFVSDTSYLPPSPVDTNAASPFKLVVSNLDLEKISFLFKSIESNLYFDVNAGRLKGQLPLFDLIQQKIIVESLSLEDTKSSLVMGKSSQNPVVDTVVTNADTTGGWVITAKDLLLKNIGFVMDDNTKPRMANQMDYSHLNLSDFYLTGSNVYFTPDTISGNIKNLSVIEKSGLNVQKLATKFLYHGQGAVLEDFYLKTPNTLLQDKLIVSYKSLDAISKDIKNLKLDIGLKNSVLGFKDLFLFLPDEQRKMLAAYKNQNLQFTILANGTVNALKIVQLYAKGLKNTEIDLAGQLLGLPNSDKLKYDFKINKLYSTKTDISPFLTKDIQQSINIPDWFNVKGKVSGTTTMYYPDVALTTNYGNATIAGDVALAQGKNPEKYDLRLNTNQLNIGRILRMEDQIGQVTALIDVKGTSFDPKKMDATFTANVLSAYYNKYTYQDVVANGHIKNQNGIIDVKSKDPNALLTMHALFDISKSYPSLTANINVDELNLKPLNFTTDEITFAGNINTNIENLNPNYPNALLSIDKPFITINGATYILDTLYVNSRPTSDSVQNIELNIANIMRGHMTGHMPLTSIAKVGLAHVNQYMKLTEKTDIPSINYNMDMAATINYHPLMKRVMPELKPFDTIRMFANITPTNLNAGMFAPKIRYNDMIIDTVTFLATEQDSVLSYVASINKFSKSNIEFYNSSISGLIRKDTITTLLNLTDINNDDQFSIATILAKDSSDNFVVSLDQGLKFNYDPWEVNPNNRIVLGEGKFYIKDLFLNQNTQSIAINSATPTFGAPMNVKIDGFQLANLTKIISKDTLLADGALSVNANIDLSAPDMKLMADLKIDSLKVMGAGLGNVTAAANNENPNAFATKLNLIGFDNDVALDGFYYLKPVNNNALDFNLAIKNLSLKSLEPLTFGNLKESKGGLKGSLKINGLLDDLNINGDLITDNLSTKIAQFNEYISLPKEKIAFSKGNITLDNFNIYDRHNTPINLDGVVTTKDYTSYFLNLKVAANKFEVINSTAKDADWLYGKLIVSLNASLKGPATAPNVNGNVTVHDSTNLTYALIDDDPSLVSNDGIVTFYDGRDTLNTDSISKSFDRTKSLLAKSASLNLNIDIQKDAAFKVLIDPETGDNLTVKGTANLNTDIGEDGSVNLTGTYELLDGSYELNYNFLKRKFKIQPGSIIQLAGNPLEAMANITAIYNTNAAPVDLVQKQTEESSELNYYRQRLPFNVLLKITGQVMKPEITFDIDLSENSLNTVNETVKSFVQSKLIELRNNPSDMNKQVFALLILGKFISEDPFSSGTAGGGFEYAARQSASRFLSDQMNNLAGNLVKGLELNMDLNSAEDYSTGSKVNRTDLNISASKRLFNDRLKVTIGNDFALEGQAQTSQNTTSLIPGNISIDYLLTSDGKYSIRGYRQTELQNIINGYMVETGLGLKLSYEYNKFKYLFINREKYFEKRRLEREAEENKLKNKEASNQDKKK